MKKWLDILIAISYIVEAAKNLIIVVREKRRKDDEKGHSDM